MATLGKNIDDNTETVVKLFEGIEIKSELSMCIYENVISYSNISIMM